MKRLFIPIILAGILALGACSGGAGFGSMRIPGLGTQPTAEEQSKLGELGTRYAALRARVDKVMGDPNKLLKSDVTKEFVRMQEDAVEKLEKLTRDPADALARAQIITVLTDLERLLRTVE
jgi:hypothetical protein